MCVYLKTVCVCVCVKCVCICITPMGPLLCQCSAIISVSLHPTPIHRHPDVSTFHSHSSLSSSLLTFLPPLSNLPLPLPLCKSTHSQKVSVCELIQPLPFLSALQAPLAPHSPLSSICFTLHYCCMLHHSITLTPHPLLLSLSGFTCLSVLVRPLSFVFQSLMLMQI